MLNADALAHLACPVDGSEQLSWRVFRGEPDAIVDAVIVCPACRAWFPVEDGIPDFLIGELAYADDRALFWQTHEAELATLGLAPDTPCGIGETDLQRAQQRHFDWYSRNEKQTYDEYERLPFWIAADGIAFSKAMVRLAAERFRGSGATARTVFMAADAMRFPVRSASLDYVMAYGVLHHVPDPPRVCREIDRVLQPGGLYFGSENGTSVFRGLFDLLQRIRPQWYEEAGPEALFSARGLDEGFAGTDIALSTRTSVFLPPHLLNHLSARAAAAVLNATDRIGGAIPLLRDNGGLILVEGRKSPSGPADSPLR
jgi:SAM-dependent methyltransferase